jgi:penicillin-insensitive murein DD-endopeptidase
MLTGHASHQVGLDADIWLTPMPDRELSRVDREEMSATMMVRPDRLDIDPKVWTPSHLLVIRAAAQEPQVERIVVKPKETEPGFPRSAQCMGMIITSISA